MREVVPYRQVIQIRKKQCYVVFFFFFFQLRNYQNQNLYKKFVCAISCQNVGI